MLAKNAIFWLLILRPFDMSAPVKLWGHLCFSFLIKFELISGWLTDRINTFFLMGCLHLMFLFAKLLVRTSNKVTVTMKFVFRLFWRCKFVLPKTELYQVFDGGALTSVILGLQWFKLAKMSMVWSLVTTCWHCLLDC